VKDWLVKSINGKDYIGRFVFYANSDKGDASVIEVTTCNTVFNGKTVASWEGVTREDANKLIYDFIDKL
jgi:hypothetical protein